MELVLIVTKTLMKRMMKVSLSDGERGKGWIQVYEGDLVARESTYLLEWKGGGVAEG